MRNTARCIVLGFVTLLAAFSAAESAETPYFQGKNVTFQVGAPAGGRQDRIARTLAKYLTKYTPGAPTFLIQNKTGGQGIPAMLALSKAPGDGSFLSMVISSYLEAPYFGAPSTGKQRNILSCTAAPASRLSMNSRAGK
jgi:tripartite-type tricarboxylate transporter receptor subunit TctC